MGVVRATVLLAVSIALGGATSLAQGLLPRALQPFANSASGWTILTALLVWTARRGLLLSAFLGAGSFVALVLGYSWVSNQRGFPFSPLFWSAIGVLVGPWVGVAAAALHQRGRWAAAGTGVLAGILVGDGVYGLTMLAATTGQTYWVIVGSLGVALLVTMAVRRLRDARLVLLAIGSAAAVALLMNAAFAALNAGMIPMAGAS